MENKNIQEKYIMLQLIAGQLAELEKEIQMVEQKRVELITLRRSLDNLSNTKSEAKSFSALGLGLYIPSKVMSNEDLLVNVGSNVLVKKSQSDVKALLDSQLEQAQLAVSQMIQNMQVLESRAVELQREIQGNV